ncbi:MAG: recombinase family protein [Caulobacterales bacterium]
MRYQKVEAALLYCRVSTKKQELSGDGNGSQEHRCRKYAEEIGVPVEAVFFDSKSGFHNFLTRPGMVAVLKHLKANRAKRYVVIFDDLKRFLRRARFYWELRDKLDDYHAVVASPNFKFDDSPEGRHHETITVAGGELEREQLRRQAIQKMIARVERGYAVTNAPIGYRYKEVKRNGHMLFPDEPLASIAREALEGYASRRFEIPAEVQRFLESHPQWPRNRSGKRANRVNETRVVGMLKHPMYAGLVSAPYWGISLRKGQHEPLISVETHHKILERLKGDKRAPARKDISADFALRGFVHCTCGSPLTASWSKGRSAEYPYYLCHNRACDAYGKSIKRDVLEGEFEALLKTLEPSPSLFRLATAMFESRWEALRADSGKHLDLLRAQFADTERQISTLLDRIVQAKTQAVADALEERVVLLTSEKLELAERIEKSGKPLRSFDQSLRTALEFLANPWKLWSSGRLDCKRTVLKLAFSGNLQYARNQGFRTAALALPFKALAEFPSTREWMVGATGIEPVTPTMST